MSLLALIALTLGPAPSVAPPALPPARIEVQDVHQKAYDAFVARFRQFLKVNDAEEMARMIRKDPAVAVRYADWLTQQVVVAGSEETEKEVNALRIAWKTAMKTNFVENLYEYHSLIEPTQRAERSRMTLEYDRAFGRYLQVVNGDRSAVGFQAASDDFEHLAKAFEAVGDFLNVGRCQIVIGTCWDDGVRGKKEANLYRACAAQKAALKAYDEVGLVGPDVSRLRIRFDSLVVNGFDAPEPDPDAPKAGQPVAAAGAAMVSVAMTFEAVPKVDTFQRPNYFADEIYQVWMALGLQGKGSSATISAQQQGSPSIERTGSAQFTVVDGSETPRDPYAVTGKLTLVEAQVGDGAKHPWAFVTKVGMQTDIYQGREANMGPSDGYMSLFYFNGASVVGTVDGVTVRVLDDNLDGIYGSPPLNWQYLGLAPGVSQPDMDCVVVGKSKRALPWSEFLPIGERWYQLKPQAGGTILQATPVELATGTVRLDFKGVFPEWLVLRGTGVLENTFVDLCANGKKKGVAVPVGEYRLVAGVIRKGKKRQTMKCLILGNEQVAPIEVEAGAEHVLELGGPFQFDFDTVKSDGGVAVAGPSVRVIGSAGETYDRFWNCVPAPLVSMRKPGAKKGGKGEDMPQVKGSLDELTETGARRWSYADVWRPMTLELEPKKPGEPFEVQLTEKKNKLLGAIASPWK